MYRQVCGTDAKVYISLSCSISYCFPAQIHDWLQSKSRVQMSRLPTFLPTPLRHNWLTDVIYHLNYAPTPLPSLASFLSTEPGEMTALLFSYRLPSGMNSSLITDYGGSLLSISITVLRLLSVITPPQGGDREQAHRLS